jgi:signal transduction histidine kinase/CheY-like chemotaxis protein
VATTSSPRSTFHVTIVSTHIMAQTTDRAADITDPQRVWEVRRFCQVRTAHPPQACGVDSKSDAALSGLLRCLLYELDADLAAITLLDEDTQHFLSVVHRSHLHDLAVRTTKWYGCEQIAHRGGICEKTVMLDRQDQAHPVYEILDLSADESTKSLPVVDGTVADFRHYAGVPLTTPGGLNIGTLFVFGNGAPENPLQPSHCEFMCKTAGYVMTQLMQTLEAMENKRSLRCNSAVSSMLESDVYAASPDTSHGTEAAKSPKLYTSFAANIYATAVDLLSHAFEINGLVIQELPSHNVAANVNQQPKDKILAKKCDSKGEVLGPISDSVARQLLEAFPSGAIFHISSVSEDRKYVASAQGRSGPLKQVELALCDNFSNAEQFVFMPLRDSFHDRDVAFVLGWATGSTRVYSSTTDLPPLASFGMAIMTQIRRLEAQMLSRNKSDFLGSMSHEMRSPLHGMMACIELLLQDTDCSAHQLDLLEGAEACGLQLRGNIDNILLYSNIGSASPRPEQSKQHHFPDLAEDVSQGKNNILALIEATIERDTRKRKSTLSSNRAKNLLWTSGNQNLNQRPVSTIITVDADPRADFSLGRYSGISVIINNLLGNCIKFTGPDACIRISLETDNEIVSLKFTDAGRGMTRDFIKHNLLVPFAQQDPLDTGTGLGLTLVQSAVQALDGETTIDTDESRGTEVSVSLPLSRIAGDLVNSNADAVPHFSLSGVPDISPPTVRLLAPTRWEHLDNPRNQRCLDALSGSLTRTLRTWLDLDFGIWEESEAIPDIVFLVHDDIERLRLLAKDSFAKIQKVVLCPDSQSEAAVQTLEPGTYATIVGPLTSSKVCATIKTCLQNIQRERDVRARSRQSSCASLSSAGRREGGTLSVTSTASNPDANVNIPIVQAENSEMELPYRTFSNRSTQPTEPRFLLVDDNAINLKVVGMYAKKCSKKPSVFAGGGQDAIDAFKTANLPSADDSAAPESFDIILLDLSMPEVSGFDVAAAVRGLEKESGAARTYIAALTGLVSDKDRAAAFAAGVDEYVTKPATLKDVQSVVANWKARDVPP